LSKFNRKFAVLKPSSVAAVRGNEKGAKATFGVKWKGKSGYTHSEAKNNNLSKGKTAFHEERITDAVDYLQEAVKEGRKDQKTEARDYLIRSYLDLFELGKAKPLAKKRNFPGKGKQ